MRAVGLVWSRQSGTLKMALSCPEIKFDPKIYTHLMTFSFLGSKSIRKSAYVNVCLFSLKDFRNGEWRADMEATLHLTEATKAHPKRKRSVYESFRSCFRFFGKTMPSVKVKYPLVYCTSQMPTHCSVPENTKKRYREEDGSKVSYFQFQTKAF